MRYAEGLLAANLHAVRRFSESELARRRSAIAEWIIWTLGHFILRGYTGRLLLDFDKGTLKAITRGDRVTEENADSL